MIRGIVLLLSLTFAFPAFALTPADCAARLTMSEAPPELQDAFSRLRKLGLSALLAEVYRGDVKTMVRSKLTPWQESVSARVSKIGKKQLVVRRPLDLSTREKQEKFLWDVATSLFELQMEPWLWSKAAVFPRDEVPKADDLTLSSIEYFARRMPQTWRDQYLDRAQILLRELYLLFITFQELKAEDMMPAQDPGRHWIIPGNIGPNVADYNLLRSKGLLQLSSAVEQRNSGPMLFGYYMAHLKRAMILASAIPALFLLPYVSEIPGFMESYKQIGTYEQRLDGAAERAESTQRLTYEVQRKREIERLTARIQAEEKKAAPDEDSLRRLKTQLETLVEKSPGGIFAQPVQE